MNRREPTAEETRMIEAIVAADFGVGPEPARRALADRVAQSPDRAALHTSMMAMWDDLGRIDPPPLAAEVADKETATNAGARLSWLPRARWALAASFVPIIVAIGLAFHLLGDFGTSTPYEIRTASDERRIVSLADGSTVSLSADTILAIDMQRDRRSLDLIRGEALFEVAHDPARPFVVGVGSGFVRAIGTAFNIRLADEVVVTVVEGTVSVTAAAPAERRQSPGVSQIATAGQQVRLREDVRDERAGKSAGSHISPATAVDADRYASWATGVLRFEGEPLSTVVAELNRYSANDVRLTDSAIADTPIYGILHIGDVDGLRSIVRDIEQIDDREAARKLVTYRRD